MKTGGYDENQTNLHVYLGNWVIFEIFVIVVFEDLVIVEGHPFWS